MKIPNKTDEGHTLVPQVMTEEKAQEIWEEMSLKEVVGKEKIDIEDLEDGIIVAIDEES